MKVCKRVVSYAHAYVGPQGQMAGGETTLHDLLVALVDDGWEVELILSDQKADGTRNDYVIDGVQVRAFADKLQLNRAIPSADLVISHLGGAQRSSIIAKGCRIPSIHVIHNDLDYTKVMSRHANYLVYNTLWVLDSFRNDRRLSRPPGIVVRPPIKPWAYKVDSTREYITLVNLADGEGGPYNKGPAMFYWLAEQFPEEKFLGVTGAYGNQDIRSLPNVTIVPNTEDIRTVFSKTKILLNPSNYESYGRTPIEAGCSGIPAITSTAPGFIEHNMGYKKVHFQDQAGWREALTDLLDPVNYAAACTSAEHKAGALWEQSRGELTEYVSECRRIAEWGRQNRRSLRR